MPALILHGDDDQLNQVDRTARATAEAIAGSTLHVYPVAPHGLPLPDRERFNRDLLAFIGRAAPKMAMPATRAGIASHQAVVSED